ncbi:MAG: hypothetical protein ABI045_01175 [Flavobacteriales bacterium]
MGGITAFSGAYIINTGILFTDIYPAFIAGELPWIQPYGVIDPLPNCIKFY